MHKSDRYLFSPNQIRLAVALGTVGMIAAVIVLYFLATAHPQGRFEPLDETPLRQHLAAANADLSGYAVDGDRAQIDIFRAIELVAERGVQEPGFYVAGAAPAAPGSETEPAAAGEEPTELPDGEQLFATTCSACHGGSGQGIPGAFPPLAGHAPEIHQADRELLIDIILFGMQGPIMVDGMAYNSLMPSHAHLGDPELAAIANYVMTAWGNDAATPDFEPYGADEVAEERAKMLTMDEVHEARLAAGLE